MIEMEGNISVFKHKIEVVCQKKVELIEESFWRYAARSAYAGAFLTMTTAVGAIAGDKLNHIDHNLGKFAFAFLFAWGLIYILFLNSELATSNMLYLTAGVYHKRLSIKKAVYILSTCTLFNLIGALITGWMFNQASAFQGFTDHSMIVEIVEGKLGKSSPTILWEAILANMFINVAIMSFILIKESGAKIAIVLSAIFMFVFFGLDHVIANFASFSLAIFNAFAGTDGLTFLNTIRQWTFAYIGNYIGGGLLIGLVFAWLNNSKTSYLD
ncbi:formate/nitrite transporter family protein [Prevotella sp. HUN102]|uniref:formate/nitrite transporter family protein n=1 Tax=Prevotella sp. HUN102 TaxID=1392486 RepID=UPI0018CC46B7|nr:formate/nitrite transporter family protein [Prevotella sp. HUN102]